MIKKECNCKDKLKALLPNAFKARCLTKKEVEGWTEYRKIRTLHFTDDQTKMVCKLFADVFSKLYFEPPTNGSTAPVREMTKKLDIVYENQCKK
tara:strand:+ start:3071 stop:3352 length:282 start_codon:yes stop_codon:yes gene_type:complete